MNEIWPSEQDRKGIPGSREQNALGQQCVFENYKLFTIPTE